MARCPSCPFTPCACDHHSTSFTASTRTEAAWHALIGPAAPATSSTARTCSTHLRRALLKLLVRLGCVGGRSQELLDSTLPRGQRLLELQYGPVLGRQRCLPVVARLVRAGLHARGPGKASSWVVVVGTQGDPATAAAATLRLTTSCTCCSRSSISSSSFSFRAARRRSTCATCAARPSGGRRRDTTSPPVPAATGDVQSLAFGCSHAAGLLVAGAQASPSALLTTCTHLVLPVVAGHRRALR